MPKSWIASLPAVFGTFIGFGLCLYNVCHLLGFCVSKTNIIFCLFTCSYRSAVSLYQGNSNQGFQNKSGKSVYCHIHWWNDWQVRGITDSRHWWSGHFWELILFSQWLHPVSEFRHKCTWLLIRSKYYSSVLCSNIHVHVQMLWKFPLLNIWS